MKRVLILTYYWPPSGGSGVQRWLKMSKYLPENGWKPVIYTAENAEYPVEDPSLEKDVCPEAEVLRRPIVEPYGLYKRIFGIQKEQKVKAGFIDESGQQTGWKARLSVWIRGNLFIPDARCWWIRPSFHYLRNYLKDHPVDALVSTGPPHSMHLIARKLKRRLDIPWVADFRDPWTEIDYYDDLRLTRWADRKQHRMERQVLTQADQVVAVGWDMAEGLRRLGAHDPAVILNGYDQAPQVVSETALSTDFTITHLGIVTPSRNNPALWTALQELTETNELFRTKLRLRLIGQIDRSVLQEIKAHGLDPYVQVVPYVPHEEVGAIQQSSQVLLLLVNRSANAKGILTGKLFEYLASGRPILCIGPEDGDAARIIRETQAGTTVGFEAKDAMKATLQDLFDRYREGKLATQAGQAAEPYSRRTLAAAYGKLLDQLTNRFQP